jgi:hypothetical protein
MKKDLACLISNYMVNTNNKTIQSRWNNFIFKTGSDQDILNTLREQYAKNREKVVNYKLVTDGEFNKLAKEKFDSPNWKGVKGENESKELYDARKWVWASQEVAKDLLLARRKTDTSTPKLDIPKSISSIPLDIFEQKNDGKEGYTDVVRKITNKRGYTEDSINKSVNNLLARSGITSPTDEQKYETVKRLLDLIVAEDEEINKNNYEKMIRKIKAKSKFTEDSIVKAVINLARKHGITNPNYEDKLKLAGMLLTAIENGT